MNNRLAIARDFAKAINNEYISKIILFGSVAREEDTEDSDIDILVVSNYAKLIEPKIREEVFNVVIDKKDGKNVAETSNEKVELVEDKHFAVNERGLHFFELGFLCDYLGYDWDVKQVKNDENNSVNLFDITLKKKK